MISPVRKFGLLPSILLLITGLNITSLFASAKTQTFTGVVSDAMCGAKHTMRGDDADCVRTCVNMGSKYDLVVGDKVYTLDTNDKTVLGQLDKLSAQQATVTGEADGDIIAVSSVVSAK
jgi:hypothetical protein